MVTPDSQRDEEQSRFIAQGQWASTLAWGFAALAALAAMMIWALSTR